MEKEDLHTLRLMGEIARDGNHSQRELSRRLNISLGLVNTFLKRLVNKGYFKVSTMPKNRVKYFLTAEGLARKSKLTAEYLRYSVNFYKDIKHLLLEKFKEMEKGAVKSVLFYGAGEVAELAYLYLQLTDIQLAGIVDDSRKGKRFFDYVIKHVSQIHELEWDMLMLTRLEDVDDDIKNLLDLGIDLDRVFII